MRTIIFTILSMVFATTAPIKANNSDTSTLAAMESRTVLIEVSCNGKLSSWGSGVIWRDSKIVTANHVIEELEREECSATARREGGFPYSISVVAADDVHDLALVESTHHYGIYTRFAPAELGEPVIVIGYPYQFLDGETEYLSVLFGNVSTLNIKAPNGCYLHRISAGIWHGNSGGPVFRYDGSVIGIVLSAHTQAPGYNYMARGSDIALFLGSV